MGPKVLFVLGGLFFRVFLEIHIPVTFQPFFSFVPKGDHVTLFVRHENGKVLTISDTNASISGLSFIDLDCWCWWCHMVSLSVKLFVDLLVLKPKSSYEVLKLCSFKCLNKHSQTAGAFNLSPLQGNLSP